MPKELNLTPPLVEAQKMIADFLCSVTHAELDLKRLAQLIEVGQQEIESGVKTTSQQRVRKYRKLLNQYKNKQSCQKN